MINNKKPIKTVDEIPFFSEDRYWGKSSKEELAEALTVIENQGWAEFKTRYQDKFDATFEENRADWHFVLSITKDFFVLDAGAGMGRISIPLARVAGQVIALDQSFLRMKFLKLKAEKENLKNIEVCVGDIFDQPFADASFDLIVMNGLLEWVGKTTRFADPREAQKESLRICYRLLKPGGRLYVGIENRLALAYLRGRDHSSLRFTSYLPRWLADAYCRWRLGQRYDTYTYTKRGYEKLIRESGFAATEFYLPYPGYNLPRIMIPYDNLKALAYVVRTIMRAGGRKKVLARWLAHWPETLRPYRYFFYSFGIIAQK